MVEACPGLELQSSASRPHPSPSATKSGHVYTLLLKLVAFFLLDIRWIERLFLKHDELPFHCVKHIEFDLINFMFRFGVNKEVFMIEERIDQKIGTIFYIINFTSRRLDEHILRYISLTFSPM